MRSTAGTIQNWACGVLKSFEKRKGRIFKMKKKF